MHKNISISLFIFPFFFYLLNYIEGNNMAIVFATIIVNANMICPYINGQIREADSR